MGRGGYDVGASVRRAEARVRVPVQTVFGSRSCHPSMSPIGLQVRKSCDSPEHPLSVAVAFLLDVTKSMAVIPEELARRTLHRMAKIVLTMLPDAQFLMGAVGDAEDGDHAPLQIGQFESSDLLVDQWLTRIYLEQGGGDNRTVPSFESYDLALLFAARMTRIDCYQNRGKKGYLFLTGDECPRERVSAQVANRVFGRTVLEHDVPLEQIIAEASEKFHIFMLIPDQRRAEDCESYWRRYLGDNVIVMEDPCDDGVLGADTALVVATLIGLTEGGFLGQHKDVGQALEAEHGCSKRQASRIYHAVLPYAANLPSAEPVRELQSCTPAWIVECDSNVIMLDQD